jgi:hypothetical protein
MGWISKSQQDRDHSGLRNACAACGHDGTKQRPLGLSNTGSRIHTEHFTNPASGLYGQQQTNDD